MRLRYLVTCFCFCTFFLLMVRASAQIKVEQNPYRKYGETQLGQYRVGASIKAIRGAVQNIKAMVAIPFECEEQDVKIIEEDITAQCEQVEYRLLREGGARQLLISIPYLGSGEEAHALITFEVGTRIILPPDATQELVIPVRPGRELKRFLGKSPFIDTNHAKIKKVARKIFADLNKTNPATSPAELPANSKAEKGESTDASAVTPIQQSEENAAESIKEPTDWQRVEAIYDFVLQHVEYVEGDDKSALQTLQDAEGDCQNISALFIALCRTNKIPARIVWVHEHNYAEFCLQDAAGKLHWFPVESAGARAFGHMPLARTILQKGDNFKVPERPRTPLRYASNFMTAQGVPGSGKPRVRYIQDQL